MKRISPPSVDERGSEAGECDIYGSLLTAHPDSRRGRPATNRGLAAHRKRSRLPNLESQQSPRSGNTPRRYEARRPMLPPRTHRPIFMSLQPPGRFSLGRRARPEVVRGTSLSRASASPAGWVVDQPSGAHFCCRIRVQDGRRASVRLHNMETLWNNERVPQLGRLVNALPVRSRIGGRIGWRAT